MYLSVQEVQRDSNLSWQAPQLVQAGAQVNDTVCIY